MIHHKLPEYMLLKSYLMEPFVVRENENILIDLWYSWSYVPRTLTISFLTYPFYYYPFCYVNDYQFIFDVLSKLNDIENEMNIEELNYFRLLLI